MRADLLMDDQFDLLFDETGDLAIGDSRVDDAALILVTYRGNWKQFPMTGVGKARFLNGPVDAGLKSDIALQLEADGLSLFDASYMVDAIKIAMG